MTALTKPQLLSMLRMQDQLNSAVDPKWLFANYAWGRAIRVEAGELTDHLGWKWWKEQKPNWEQARLECVDIWHFMLSLALVDAQGSHSDAADTVLENLKISKMEVLEVLGRRFTINGLALHEAVDVLSGFASFNFALPVLFESVMVGVGLTWESLYTQYVGKNTLNLFRNAHGYQQGTYEKLWHGEEDNVWLARIQAEQPGLSPEQLREELWKVYSLVPSEAMQQPLI